MQDNFNLAKFVRQNRLLNENIGGYVDIKPLKEMSFDEMMGTIMEGEPEGDQYDAKSGPAITSELEKPKSIYVTDDSEDEKGFIVPGDEDEFDSQNRMMDLGGDQIEQGIISLLDDGFEAEDVMDFCKMIIDAHSEASAKGLKF